MRLILVEDDEHKERRIEEFINSVFTNVILTKARSIQSGIKALEAYIPDLILLDMSLPVFDYSPGEQGFQHLSYGGRDIMDYIDGYDMQVPVIVVTAFNRFGDETDAFSLEELGTQLGKEYPNLYSGIVWYNALEDIWKNQLISLIDKALNCNHES